MPIKIPIPIQIGRKQKLYRVRWEIDLVAHSPKAAAQAALRIQRDAGSDAVVFEVAPHPRVQSADWRQARFEQIDLNL